MTGSYTHDAQWKALFVLQDVDGYESTSYYTDRQKNDTGYNMTGMNTSSSVGDMQTMESK